MAVGVLENESDCSVASAIERFGSLLPLVVGVDIGRCGDEELAALTASVREGQQALDVLLMRIAVVAEQRAQDGTGRGAHGTLLGDGRSIRGRAARQEAARAKAAAELSKVGEAMMAGCIGAEQVDAITRASRSLTAAERDLLNTDDLIDAAITMPADLFARHVRRMVDEIKGDHGLGDTKSKRERSSWNHWFDERSGMGHVHGEFDPERYEEIISSVEAELTRLANHGGVSKGHRLAADAAHALLTGSSTSGASGRPRLSVVVDWETLMGRPHAGSIRETADGHDLPLESISRLACDAVLQRVVLDTSGVPINVGRTYRTATDAQWQAIRATYRTCAWAGCDAPLAWCQLHHVHEWEHGGATDLCNLIPLCSRHHHSVHEGGWSVNLNADDRRLDIVTPDGRHFATTRPDRMVHSPARGSPKAA